MTDRISVGNREGSVALVLTHPHTKLALIFQTTPAVARQLAASILNQADEIDEESRSG